MKRVAKLKGVGLGVGAALARRFWRYDRRNAKEPRRETYALRATKRPWTILPALASSSVKAISPAS